MKEILLVGLMLPLWHCGCDTGASRTYATRYAVGGATYDCLFDKSSISLTCSTGSSTITTKYASVADFIDEVKLVGRILASGTLGPGDYMGTYTYDAQNRLTTYINFASAGSYSSQIGEIVSSWDSEGRPTAAHAHSYCCKGSQYDYDESWSYDDAARSVVYMCIGTNCGGPRQTIYDADGIVRTINGQSVDVRATDRICE